MFDVTVEPFSKCTFLKANTGNNFLLGGLKVRLIAKTDMVITWQDGFGLLFKCPREEMEIEISYHLQN